jgi:hypothetical protein
MKPQNTLRSFSATLKEKTFNINYSKRYTKHMKIDYKKLADKILSYFADSSKLIEQKNIPEFFIDGTFYGDVYLNTAFKLNPGGKNRVYQNVSPYDVASGKAPNQLLVFEAGALVDSVDWEQNVKVRTGVMDAVILKTLKVKTLDGSKILYIGSGKIAKCSIEAIKQIYGEVAAVDYTNRSHKPDIETQTLYKNAHFVSKIDLDLSVYDFIFCHTNSKEVVIDLKNLPIGGKAKLKVLSYHMDSSIGLGVSPDWLSAFVSTFGERSLVIDNADTLRIVKELQLVKMDKSKVTMMTDLVRGSAAPTYPVVFRTGGSAMQNVALYEILEHKKQA